MFHAGFISASTGEASRSSSPGTIISGVVITALVGIGIHLFRQQQMARYESWAKAQGFAFRREDKALGRKLRDVFDVGGFSHSTNSIVIMPSRHGSCLYGEFTWEEQSGSDNRRTSIECGFVRYDLRAPLPNFLIKPEGMLSRKYNDINTEWDEFNRRWEVRASDRQFALALLTPVMQEFIMTNMQGLDLIIEGRYAYLKVPKYVIEDSIRYRALMEGWDDKVVPFLWQKGRAATWVVPAPRPHGNSGGANPEAARQFGRRQPRGHTTTRPHGSPTVTVRIAPRAQHRT